jgi:hypothetical protein
MAPHPGPGSSPRTAPPPHAEGERAASFALTRHARVRLRQRGLRERDVEVVLRYGVAGGEAVVLTRKAAAAAVAELRRSIAQIERLRGAAVFTREAAVVTLFRPSAEQIRRLLRRKDPIRRVRRTRHAHPRVWV